LPHFPFLSGIYTTGPGLVPLSKNGLPDNRVFDIDDEYAKYLDNKRECRKELDKHLCTTDFSLETEIAACTWIAKELARSYPSSFVLAQDKGNITLDNMLTGKSLTWNDQGYKSNEYLSLFDAISNQVQEDLAVFRLEGDRDWLAAIHLCAPNHWDPRDKVGRHFPDIHTPVPAMERTVSQYKPMLQSVINRGPFARYAWGVDTDDKLNHHPAGPNKRTDDSARQYYIRMERQHLVGLPAVNAFLFTIRTYFFDVEQLNSDERKALASAVRSMTPASLEYKRMDRFVDDLLSKLEANAQA
jgi:hypothetical protein